jgi:NADH dehydrogenase
LELETFPHVVIIGGGFGGLYCAKMLARHKEVRITVVDRKNHHTFQPLLYQVASAVLSPGEIASPIRGVLGRKKNVNVILGEAVGFDLAAHQVYLRELPLSYDFLVVAAGATHSYFGHDEWEEYAPGLKTIEDALEIRRRVLLAYEIAERRAADHPGKPNAGLPGNPAAGETQYPLNFVVVGGGPTGVELAGALADIAREALIHDFRSIDPSRSRVLLLEGGPRVLATYPEDLSQKAQQQLEKLGVEVHTGTAVTNIEPGVVHVGQDRIEAAVILWAAGVRASPLGAALGAPTDRAGRVNLERDLSVPGHPEVFVIGDLAAFKGPGGKLLPGVAPVAIQQGKAAAANIWRRIKGQPTLGFVYRDKGSLATIGRSAAVAEIGKAHFSGMLAWLLWLVVHILYLIGFRNRLIVMLDWAWAYFTRGRGIRLITGSTELPGVTEGNR